MPARYIVQLFLLAAIWGSSFLFIRLAAPYFGTVPLIAVRSMVAAAVLSPLLMGRKQWQFARQYAGHLFITGIISTALPFLFLVISTTYTSAGFASIINALTPIFSALIGLVWFKERLSASAITGITLGFIGVAVMMLDKDTITTSNLLLPVAAGLAATFFYGLTGFYSRRFLVSVPSTVISAGCQISSAICLAPLALFVWPETTIPWEGWALASILGIFCTGAAFIIYFHLLGTIGVTRTVIVTYLIPLFALLWGKLFLDETITFKMIAGAALILTGIGLTTRTTGTVK